jgi:hypothetical protein
MCGGLFSLGSPALVDNDIATESEFVIYDLRFTIYDLRMAGAATMKRMTRQQILDLYFLEARSKVIDVAAFLDRVERAGGTDDFRMKALRRAVAGLSGKKKQKAKNALLAFSDLTTKPIPVATTKAACGAFPGTK